jgi:hypothetical protein
MVAKFEQEQGHKFKMKRTHEKKTRLKKPKC